MKPDAYRLKLETYPLVSTIPSRFQDLDPLGHINNVAIGAFYEEGRSALNRKAFPLEMRKAHGMRMVIADVHIAYLDEAFYPSDLVVGSGILRIGGSSYTIGQGLFQDGRCIGASEAVLVNTDGKRPTAVPDEARSALETLMIQAP